MERSRPHLVSVDAAQPTPPGPRERSGARPGRRTSLILALLLAAALSGLLAQSWRASRLEARLGELEARLGVARQELEAREEHLGRVREAVEGVRLEVQALEALVEQEP